MTASSVRFPAAKPVQRRWTDRLPILTAVCAAVHVLLGGWWLLDPGAFPFRYTEGPVSLLAYLDPRVGAAVFTGLAATGLVVALAMRRGVASRLGQRALLAVAAVLAVAYTVAVPDGRVIMMLGYLMAVAVPVGLLTLAVVGSVRHWQIRLLALALVALGVLALATGWANVHIFTAIGRNLVLGFARNGLPPLVGCLALLGGVLWAGMAVRWFRQGKGRCLPCGRPGASWTRAENVARWGRWVTVVAICCPLPYALQRATWLTPWSIGVDAADLAAQPSIRLWGLCLGAGAVVGALLTTGLISRWGERWPFWMPVLAGRPIPWQVAVIPAGVVTCALLAAAQGFTVTAVQALVAGDHETLLLFGVFPFGLWAVALGAATVAYYYRRRGRCTACGRS